MNKEVGDLRLIAETLEGFAGIDSEEVSPKLGDLHRIADALGKLAGEKTEESAPTGRTV